MADIEHIFPPYMRPSSIKPATSSGKLPPIMAKAQQSMPAAKATAIQVRHTR